MKNKLFTLFLILTCLDLHGQSTLVLGSFPTTSPYLIINNKIPVGGIVKDLADKVAFDLELKVEYNFPPKNRTDFAVENKLVSVLPICHPDWVKEPEKFHWSSPLFIERAVFATNSKTNISITRVEDLNGLNIGTITGYFYPELKSLLENKVFTRDDSQTLFRNLSRLERQWINAVYDSEILLKYKARDPSSNIKIQPLVLSSKEIFWAIPKSSNLPYQKIFKRLSELVKDGTVGKILNKYN